VQSVTALGSPAHRAAPIRPDCISTAGAAFLRAELDRHPAIRPEVIARGLLLRDDPAYPPPAALKAVAATILASPDLSSDEF